MAGVWQMRTHTPLKTNRYYLRKDRGGFNAFTTYNMFENGGNCTSYAWGRFIEVGSYARKGIIKKTCSLPLCDAQNWYPSCTAYMKGKEPRLGAVACWKKKGANSGHVAIVEKITATGITTSESGWHHYMFKNVTYKRIGNEPYLAGFEFQGYIYNPWESNNYQ